MFKRKKKILIVLTKKGKKHIVMAIVCLLFVMTLNTVIFAAIIKNRPGPLEGKNIIIDPGHGGIDSGTNDGTSFFEKDINLQIAKILQKDLISSKANVELTRYSDISLDSNNPSSKSRHLEDLSARVSQFNSGKYDIFISIHVNHSTNSNARGPFVLYSANSTRSSFLAISLQKRLNQHSESFGPSTIQSPVESNYFIFRHSNIPGVLVETGFISNASEKALLKEEDYQQKLANSILNGIKDYYENFTHYSEPSTLK